VQGKKSGETARKLKYHVTLSYSRSGR